MAHQWCTLTLTGGDQVRWDKPQRALQVNGVVEFHWNKLRRRNDAIKQAVENHVCSNLSDGLSLNRRIGQEQGEDMARVEAGCSSEAETH